MRKIEVTGYIEISDDVYQELQFLNDEAEKAYANKDYDTAHKLNASSDEIIELYKTFLEIKSWDFW